jgi:3-hydroxybutyryl-CoA dehydratase
MTVTFDSVADGDTIEGPKFAVSHESIRLFCDASLDSIRCISTTTT